MRLKGLQAHQGARGTDMRIAMNRQDVVWIIVSSIVLVSTLVPRGVFAWQDTPPPAILKSRTGDPAIRKLSATPEDQETRSAKESQEASSRQRSGVRASSFQGVTPGETTAAQLVEMLGEPVARQSQGAEEVLTYQVGPFPKVEVIVTNDTIASVVIFLDSLASPQDISQELKLGTFEAVPIRSESGALLGQIYPERGVMFSFDPDAAEQKVGQLVLEQITAEPFLMRVRQDRKHQYARNLTDLAHAQEYAPDTGEIYWLKARILQATGDYRRALSAVDKAIELTPDDSRLLTTRAKIHFELDDHEAAIADAKSVIADKTAPPEYQARAKCQLADFIANGPEHQYNEALQIHQEALQMGVQLATTDRTEVRRYAKRVLVDAYFGVANDIARGRWQDKQETMLKWLKGASEIAYGMLEFDQGESVLRLEIIHKTLTSYAGLKINADAKKAVSQLLDELDQIVGRSTDAGYQNELRWIAVETIYQAIEIARVRGDHQQVLQFAEHANRLVEQLDRKRERTAHSDYLVGKIYFYAGLAESIANEDHQKAVRYFEKALPYFSKDLPARNIAERGLHGERFVSMGVSYWRVNAQDEAVNLTQRGLEIMVLADREGRLADEALAVPYGNLATMYEALEEPERASRMASRAAEIESR
jgi:tetratricopeptide (TPR) repeat protein